MSLSRGTQILVIMWAAIVVACRSVWCVCMKTPWIGSTYRICMSRVSGLEIAGCGCLAGAPAVDQRKGSDSIIELRPTDCPPLDNRNLEGPAKGAEIMTTVGAQLQSPDIVVDFFVPDVHGATRQGGQSLRSRYEVLYADEDVRMMTERQHSWIGG